MHYADGVALNNCTPPHNRIMGFIVSLNVARDVICISGDSAAPDETLSICDAPCEKGSSDICRQSGSISDCASA